MAAKRLVFYFIMFCQIFGIAIFLKGFFPLKKNSPRTSENSLNGSTVRSKFDRLIIVMVDALRADFVLGNDSYMNFTKRLIDSSDSYSFQAHSNPPTVTMPRIKAITTGTIPGFIDVILNVDSKELYEDNLVKQMRKSKKKIIFFGDDTWIKLFPNYFQRHDGTTSFFVSDYTEVDNNVTRHVVPEMAKQDWDVMILHYLGLDHIGHLAGPYSPLVQPKLVEMDQIIEKIYRTAVRQDLDKNITTLMVLCGDHGMSDGGSHGGSSFAETTTPLVFMSSLFERGQGKPYNMRRVNQIDIAPTLAVLFGLSIPKNSAAIGINLIILLRLSIGILILDLLTRYSVKERLDAIRMNALQISDVYQSNTDNESVVDLDLAARLHNEWLREYESHIGIDVDARAETISKLYYSGMQTMTEKLTKFMSSYDFYALYIGIWFLVQSLLSSVCLFVNVFPQDFSSFFRAHICSLFTTFFVIACLTTAVHVLLCSTPKLGISEVFCSPSIPSFSLSFIFIVSSAITLLGIVSVLHNLINRGFPSWIRTFSYGNTKTLTFLIFGMLLHNISLLSTSFIEEEHQTWYFLTTSYHFIVLYEINIQERGIFRSYFSRKESSEDVSLHHKGLSMSDLTKDTIKDMKLTEHEGQNIQRSSTYVFILLLCDRISRSWNQTGMKWADQADVGDWLVNPENKTVLTLLTIIFLVGITLNILYRLGQNKCDFFTFAIFTSGVMNVYLYRAATDCVDFSPWIIKTSQTGIEFAQITHLCVSLLVLISLFQFMFSWKVKRFLTQQLSPVEVFVTGYLLLIMLLLRTHNIPLVAMMLLQVHVHREVVWKRCESDTEIILSAYYVGWFTYFSQGNSNSFATVDIGAGYIGLGKNYWPVVVGLQTSLATFSGPLFWVFQAVIFIQSRQSNRSGSHGGVGKLCTILLLIKSFNLIVCTILSWLNCYHLFVWSVFSPKLLYEGVVSLIFCIVILTVTAFIKIKN